MTTFLLAGGGTAGHVNPMLAVAEELVRSRTCTVDEIVMVGTKEGLESRLVPAAGYTLETTAKVPFPRKINLAAFLFLPRLAGAVFQVIRIIRRHRPDVIAGFGGYASAPSYLAAWLTKTPLVIHEANAVPGFANRLGARLTPFVAITFRNTPLQGARVLGMPLARAISHPAKRVSPSSARSHFGLAPRQNTVVVTGGSQGSVRINSTVEQVANDFIESGWQVLHIVGEKNPLPNIVKKEYVALTYCDRMDLAFAAATVVISRAGSATVSEIQRVGVPAIFVPYPVGNGEQEKNAMDSLQAGAAVLVHDHDFTPEYVRTNVLPLLGDATALQRMREMSHGLGHREAAQDFVALMLEALQRDRTKAKR